MSRTTPPLPLPVQRALARLGPDIRLARRRRGIAVQLMADRCLISRPTLRKVERGDPSVSMGIYATVLFVLGMEARVGALADPSDDPVALALDAERLPTRIRSRRG